MQGNNEFRSLLDRVFQSLVDAGDVDIVSDPDDRTGDAFEVQTDEWTLLVKGHPVTRAWIAVDVDSESSQPASLRHELEHVLTADDVDAMLALDDMVDGSLIHALESSHDPLSEELARLLVECRLP